MSDRARLEEIVRKAAMPDGPSASDFETYLRDRIGTDREDGYRLADLYLAFACAAGSKVASSRLAEELLKTSVASRRVRIPDATVEDARQVVFERLIAPKDGPPKITTYDGRGPLRAWLRVALAREALYVHRLASEREAEDGIDRLVEMAAPEEDPEFASLKHELRVEYRAALKRAARALGTRERALLRQHLVLGMPIDAIGPLYGVHRATAARWLVSAKDALLETFYAELEASTGLDRREATRLRGLIQSRLDVSLDSALASTAAGSPCAAPS